jgi:ATP/maltotriose-dependent transcriptional regulator MalT
VIAGDLHEASNARREASRIAEQIDSVPDTRWHQGTLTEDHYRVGSWDDAIEVSDSFLAFIDAGNSHYMTGQVAAIRAEIRLSRGDTQGALDDAERALAQRRVIADPQVAYLVAGLGADVLSLAGDRDSARAVAGEYLDVLRRRGELQFAVITLPAFAAAAERLGLAGELIEAIAGHSPSPWIEAASAFAHGEFAAAANVLRRIGSRPDEAYARLRAAQEAAKLGRDVSDSEELQSALAFFRSVRASRFVTEAESLLDASAAATE